MRKLHNKIKKKNPSCSVSQTSFIHEDFHILHKRLCLRRQKRDGALGAWIQRWTTATHPHQAPSDLHDAPIPHHPRCQMSCISGIIQT